MARHNLRTKPKHQAPFFFFFCESHQIHLKQLLSFFQFLHFNIQTVSVIQNFVHSWVIRLQVQCHGPRLTIINHDEFRSLARIIAGLIMINRQVNTQRWRWRLTKFKRNKHTFPSLPKYFSRSLLVILVDKPVTYKLFPGLSALTESRLLLQQKPKVTSSQRYEYQLDMLHIKL